VSHLVDQNPEELDPVVRNLVEAAGILAAQSRAAHHTQPCWVAVVPANQQGQEEAVYSADPVAVVAE
jgi:hypothetical protein